ncbi:hypothetical protein C0992_012208, partial [Termitomyces sp. T32_za158]
SETANSSTRLSIDEIKAQWALIELCRNLEVQHKLREELKQFSAQDPSFEELTNGLPYLDAVIRETLRLHPALPEANRVVCPQNVGSVRSIPDIIF